MVHRKIPLHLSLLVILLWILSCALAGCAALSKSGSNPLDELGSSARLETIALFSTGNIQGALLPGRLENGGGALLESYYKITQRDFGNRTVWLDAGNIRGNSFDFVFDHGKAFSQFLQKSGVSVILDGGSDPNLPYRELEKNQAAFVIVPAGRLKLGVISARNSNDVIRQSQEARDAGANLVVWLSDLPIRCSPHHEGPMPLFHRPGEPNGFCQGALYDVVSQLPIGTINAVLASGSDEPLEQFIYPRYSSDPFAGVAVVEASPFAKTADVIYLSYDLKENRPIFAKTRIEGPVQICTHVFEHQGDCDASREPPQNGRGPWVPARFHGRKISVDSGMASLASEARQWLASQQKIILARSKQRLASTPTSESSFGDLIADALRDQTHSDFALVHPGLFSHASGDDALPAGPISWATLSRALPADTSVSVIRVSGDELKKLVRISESGNRGFAAVSGMKLRLIRPDRNAPASDLNGDHHLSSWEQNRVIEITDLEDEPIQKRKKYLLAVPTFLLQGGDDWGWADQALNLTHRIDAQAGTDSVRQTVAAYLKQQGTIDAINPRIRFEMPPGKHSRRHHRRHHRIRGRRRVRHRP